MKTDFGFRDGFTFLFFLYKITFFMLTFYFCTHIDDLPQVNL